MRPRLGQLYYHTERAAGVAAAPTTPPSSDAGMATEGMPTLQEPPEASRKAWKQAWAQWILDQEIEDGDLALALNNELEPVRQAVKDELTDWLANVPPGSSQEEREADLMQGLDEISDLTPETKEAIWRAVDLWSLETLIDGFRYTQYRPPSEDVPGMPGKTPDAGMASKKPSLLEVAEQLHRLAQQSVWDQGTQQQLTHGLVGLRPRFKGRASKQDLIAHAAIDGAATLMIQVHTAVGHTPRDIEESHDQIRRLLGEAVKALRRAAQPEGGFAATMPRGLERRVRIHALLVASP